MTALVKLKVSIFTDIPVVAKALPGLVLQSIYRCKVLIMEALPEFKIFSKGYLIQRMLRSTGIEINMVTTCI